MTRSIAVAGTVLAAVMLAGIMFAPVTLVRVADRHGTVLLCARTPASSPLTLTFTHSMYGGDVSETYVASGGDLRRTGIQTDNAAAAEYYARDGAVGAVDGGYQLLVPEVTVPMLPFVIDDIGRHRLIMEGATWDLAGMVDGPTPARLSVVSRPLVTQVFGTRC